MDKGSIKKFKKYNLRFYLIIVAVIFLVYPKLVLIHSNMNIIIPLFLWTGVGTVYFSHKFLSSLESTKDNVDLNDFFTPQGRAALKKNPKAYFDKDGYAKYSKSYFYMVVFFMLSIIVFAGGSISILM